MLKPLGDRVVLKIEEKEQTVGGFVLAGSAQEKTKTAKVVAIGQGVRTLSGELVAPSVKVGDQVLVEAHAARLSLVASFGIAISPLSGISSTLVYLF